MQKLSRKFWAFALVFALCLSNIGYAAAVGNTTAEFDGPQDSGNPVANAVDGKRDTHFVINSSEVSGKTITINFNKAHTGMKIVSGQNGEWSDHISAPADIYVKVGDKFVKTSSINTPGGTNIVKESEGVYVHTISFGGYKAAEVQVRFTGNAASWQRIREIEGTDSKISLEKVDIMGLAADGVTLNAKTTPSLTTGVTYSWKINGTEVSSESSYKIKAADVGAISLTVTYDGKTLSTPAYPIMKEYATIQGSTITHEGLNANKNNENLDLELAIDGQIGTMAKINNTTDLKGKSVTVKYDKAPTGLRILSGNPGDKLTAPVDVYLSTDGTNWSKSPVATISANQIAEDGEIRVHEVLFANEGGACYVKLLFTDNSPSGWSRVREIYGLDGVAKENPSVENANLALDATASASGSENDSFPAAHANDGNYVSRWGSKPLTKENGPQWLRLDFGSPKTFNQVKLFWERAAGKNYKLQYSDNGSEWKDIVHVTDGAPGEVRSFGFAPVTARYVQVIATENFPEIWNTVSIYEMEVYNNSWDVIRDKTVEQLNAAHKWGALTQDVSLIQTSGYGAQISWSADSKYLAVNNGTLKVTLPETTQKTNLTATITYGENTYTHTIPVVILSQQDMDNSYDLNPNPHKLDMKYDLIDFGNVKVYYEDGVSQITRDRVAEIMKNHGVTLTVVDSYEKSNLALGIKGSGGSVDTNTEGYSKDLFTTGDNKFDIHYLDINKNGRVTVLGQHDDAVYYALATLDAAMKQVKGQKLACATIEDYANMQYRGVVEGFYGKVYTVEDILSIFDYMEANKMNTFVYGPKGDPYHLGNWRDDYPTEITDEQRFFGQMTQEDMRKIAAAAAANNINFVWSIHPAMQNGINFTDRNSVNKGIEDILKKFDHMYKLGVRQFGVFVDDINLSIALQGSDNQGYMIAELQRRLEAKYNTENAKAEDRVGGTFYVPSFYGLDFGSHAQLQQNLGAFKKHNEGNNVIMMMTGAGCWSSITDNSLKRIKEYTGKKPVMWWNYPVNDNIDDQLYMNRLDAAYGVDLDVVDGLGILSNPMNQAEASKVSLHGVADYTWNTANFNAYENWVKSFGTYTSDPALQNALLVFATYASKNQDFSGINNLFEAYKKDPTQYQAIMDKMTEITDACQRILALKGNSDKKLSNLEEEIRPWVYRLNDTAQIIIDCMQSLHGEENQKFTHMMNAVYLYNGIDSLDKYKTESLEGQGTSQSKSYYIVAPGHKYILPFARYTMGQASRNFFPADKGPFVFTDSNIEGWTLNKTGNVFAAATGKVVDLAPGSYVEFDLAALVQLASVNGLTDLKAEISLDGKTWTDFAVGAQARYVRVLNTTNEKVSVDLDKISIAAQVVSVSSITSSAEQYEPNNYPFGNVTDHNFNSFVWLKSQSEGTSLTITYNGLTAINRIEFGTTTDGDRLVGKVMFEYQNAKGDWIAVGTVDTDDFSNGNTAVDFDLVQAKAIRATITQSRSGNWLKLTEFHGLSTARKSVVTVNGVEEGKLCDKDLMTFVNLTGSGEIIFNVYESIKANDLTLYNAKGNWNGVKVYAVTADGETLLDFNAAESNKGCRVYSAGHLKGVTAFRIAYTDGIYLNEINTAGERFVALNIYGIQEQVDAAKAAAAKGGYTAESVEALNQAIAAVEALLKDNALGEPVAKAAMDAAVEAMNKAVDGLVAEKPAEKPADKTLLEQTIAKAEGMNLDGYTAESVQAFQNALKDAKAVMDNETLTEKDQAVVDTAVTQLEEAIKGLTKDTTPVDPEKPEPEPEKPAPDVKPEPEKPNPTPAPDVKPEPPKTGDNSSVMMWVTVAMASLAGVACAAVALLDSDKRRRI